MHVEFVYKGYFYRPNDQKQQLPGILKFSQAEGVTLELFGQFPSPTDFPSDEEAILLGFTSDGKKVTLSNCVMNTMRNSFPGFPTSSYSAVYLLVGEHFKCSKDILFDMCSVEYDLADNWLAITGFEPSSYNYETNELVVKYKQPAKLRFQLTDWTIETRFVFTRPLEYFIPRGVTIEQRPIFDFIPSSPTTFKKFQETCSNFSAFVALNYYEYPKINSYKFYLKQAEGNEQKLELNEITLYYAQGIDSRNYKNRNHQYSFLLQYEDYGEDFEAAIAKWYHLCALYKASIDILTGALMNRKKPTELHFLSLVKALENLHRRSINPSRKITLNNRLDELVTMLPDKVHDAVIGNEIDFTQRVTKNRNYFTHYSADNEKHAASLSQLYTLSEKLKIILITIILLQLQLPKEKVERLIIWKGMYMFNHIVDPSKFSKWIKEGG